MKGSVAALIREELEALFKEANGYFARGIDSIGSKYPKSHQNRDAYWDFLEDPIQQESIALTKLLLQIGGRVAALLKGSPLTGEGDQRDLQIAVKTMRAALHLRQFFYYDADVVHDEGTVLGFKPASQSDELPIDPHKARRLFNESSSRVLEILDLIGSGGTLSSSEVTFGTTAAAKYRPGTAFIIMWMEKGKRELDDVCDAIKEICADYEIRAVRADDIQHEDLITKRILDEISTAEFLFADLTGARPSVYYEVGYAHAIQRRVILFRKAGTAIHFDLAGFNCPEYENIRELKDFLHKRLAHNTGKAPKSAAQSG